MLMEHWPWFLSIAILGGLVRGLTGFGGAMVMTLPLAWFMAPSEAISVVFLLESVSAIPLLRRAYRHCSWQTLVPICASAAILLPFGVAAQSRMDPETVRSAIASMVVIFSVLLMLGIRMRREPFPWASSTIGGVSGFLTGLTGIGGAPVIVYLLASKDPAEISRANLMIFITFIASFGLLVLALNGLIGLSGFYLMLMMTPIYLIGGFGGDRLVHGLPVVAVRRFTLSFLALSGLVSLVV